MEDIRDLTGAINNLATSFIQSQVLFAANEANVFALLDEPTDFQTVAQQLDWPIKTTRMLLDALVALDLVVKSGGQYLNTELATTCLIPGRPHYQGNIIRHQAFSAPAWAQLGEVLRTGQPAHAPDRQRSPEELRAFILGMSDIGRLSAREMLESVDLSEFTHLLDVGGGPGTYALAFLEANPHMRATVFDRPDVLEIAREQATAAGLAGRVTLQPGDLTSDPLGAGYDLVLVSNIIHSYSADRNRELTAKCFDALLPGGTLIIKDFLVNNVRTGPAFSLLFALRMQIANGEGDTYTCEEVAEWTRNAGFNDGRLVELSPQTRLWIATKP